MNECSVCSPACRQLAVDISSGKESGWTRWRAKQAATAEAQEAAAAAAGCSAHMCNVAYVQSFAKKAAAAAKAWEAAAAERVAATLVSEQQAPAEQQEQQAPAEQQAPWNPPSNTTGINVHVVVLGLHGELHVTVPVGAWTCLDLRKVCCQRWGVTLPSTDMTQCRWLGNRGRLEDTKPLEGVVRWQRGDNKIYVSRVISAAPAEQHQAAPAEQQAAPAEQQRQVALEQAAPAEQQQAAMQAAPAEQHTTNDGDTALLEHNRHRPHRHRPRNNSYNHCHIRQVTRKKSFTTTPTNQPTNQPTAMSPQNQAATSQRTYLAFERV